VRLGTRFTQLARRIPHQSTAKRIRQSCCLSARRKLQAGRQSGEGETIAALFDVRPASFAPVPLAQPRRRYRGELQQCASPNLLPCTRPVILNSHPELLMFGGWQGAALSRARGGAPGWHRLGTSQHPTAREIRDQFMLKRLALPVKVR